MPTAPCQAVCKGQRNGKSQSLTRVHNPCGQGSQTHQVRTWSQRKKGRSAISPSQGTAPVGSSWTSDAAGCGVPCGVTARRAPLSLDDQNSQGEWTQVILLSFYSETMWKLPACGRRRDRSPPGPCEFSLSPGFSCHSLTFSRWPEVDHGPWALGLRFWETRGEGLSPQKPVFRLRNCSPSWAGSSPSRGPCCSQGRV